MFAFAVKRILQAMIVMLIISCIGFAIKHNFGDPVRDLVGQRVTPAERAEIREQLGLNDPFLVQYVRFLGAAAKGDLGLSYFFKKPATEVILKKAPATLELVFCAALIITLLSVPLGIYAAIKPKSLLSRIVMGVSTVGVSMPVFLTAILLIYIFSV
ncbi:ABC transporter permease, partial [Pseudodesulfovibrio aespoeensis]|nr:ABC transporter permease [Pseudomonadota bacterium]MCG2731883.1 ABC transporter permease [Pseudodesulfovibrio aespoeensis]